MRTRIALLVCVMWFIAVPASVAQDVAADRMYEELAGVHDSLERLVALLETLLENQQVDLLLKRIELMERRLEPTARHLRNAESNLEASEGETQSLRMMLEQQRQQVEIEIRGGADPANTVSQRRVEELEAMIEVQEARLTDREARLRELEDDLARRREDVEILDDLLLEKLE